MKHKEKIIDREQLKSFFTKGSLPSESDFVKLIDSTFNKADDKLDIDEEDGLMIYPSGNESDKLISFFQNIDDTEPSWEMGITEKESGGIYITKKQKPAPETNSQDAENKKKEDEDKEPIFYLQKEEGNVGLGTDSPQYKLDVKGLVTSAGRVGNYREGEKKADGSWYNIFEPEGLSGFNAFEITAFAEDTKNKNRFSLMHAVAVCTLGNSKPKITKTVASYGKKWNKIDLRWESRPTSLIAGETEGVKEKIIDIPRWWKKLMSLIFKEEKGEKYNLQIRTKSNYDIGGKIYFKVSVLWNSDFVKPTK